MNVGTTAVLAVALATINSAQATAWAAAPAPSPQPSAAMSAGPEVALHDGKMTVRTAAASRREALAAVAKLSGAELHRVAADDGEPASLALEDLTAADAMKRILRPRSFLLFRSRASGEPRRARVVVMSPTDGKPAGLDDALAANLPCSRPPRSSRPT